MKTQNKSSEQILKCIVKVISEMKINTYVHDKDKYKREFHNYATTITPIAPPQQNTFIVNARESINHR